MGHQCKNHEVRELRMILVNIIEKIKNVQWEAKVLLKAQNLEVGGMMELALKSMIRLSTPRTMKVQGPLGEDMILLFDCRTTSNFYFLVIGR